MVSSQWAATRSSGNSGVGGRLTAMKASMACESASMPEWAVTDGGHVRVSSGSTTNRGGLSIEVAPRHAELSSGDQGVQVRVTRNGRAVANARVDITARLNPRQYVSINAPRTDNDGRSEVSWKMEGPPGTYQIVVEIRVTDDADPVEATASFKWQP